MAVKGAYVSPKFSLFDRGLSLSARTGSRIQQRAAGSPFLDVNQFAGPLPVFHVAAVGFAVSFPEMIGALPNALLAAGGVR